MIKLCYCDCNTTNRPKHLHIKTCCFFCPSHKQCLNEYNHRKDDDYIYNNINPCKKETWTGCEDLTINTDNSWFIINEITDETNEVIE